MAAASTRPNRCWNADSDFVQLSGTASATETGWSFALSQQHGARPDVGGLSDVFENWWEKRGFNFDTPQILEHRGEALRRGQVPAAVGLFASLWGKHSGHYEEIDLRHNGNRFDKAEIHGDIVGSDLAAVIRCDRGRPSYVAVDGALALGVDHVEPGA